MPYRSRPVLSSRIERTLRRTAPAVAALSIVGAGGWFAAAVAAREPPSCDDGIGEPVPPAESCVDTTTTTTTTTAPLATETIPVTEPSPETAPTETVSVAPATIVSTESTRTPPPPRTTPAATTTLPPKTTTAEPSAPAPAPVEPVSAQPQTGTPALSGGPYVFPVAAQSSFTDTWGLTRATVGWHHGVDIFASCGAPLVAVSDGALFSVGENRIGGRRLWLRDRAGNYFYYAHLSAFAALAADGVRVRAGTVLGFVGNTGDAAGGACHLHFEIHPSSLLSLGYDGAVDPFAYVSAWRRPGRLSRDMVMGIRSDAPVPGAILIGFKDISSADGLAPARLERTFDEPVAAQTMLAEVSRPATGSEPKRIPRPRAEEARIARTLDAEAGRPQRYDPSVWDTLASCESGGNWNANTGNGYVGGLQFLPQTWSSHGGGALARSPHLATRAEQIAVAQRVLQTQGWAAWPACSAMLGLRTDEGR